MHLQIAAVGWDHERWCDDFYPPDMPADWRLTYYANEFQAVLVPTSAWLREPMPDLRQWHDDTPAEFRFYMQVTTSLLNRFDLSSVIQCLSTLEEKLSVVVVDHNSDEFIKFTKALQGLSSVAEVFEEAGTLSKGDLRSWRSVEGNVIGWLRDTRHTDLRKLRTDLERFVQSLHNESGVIFIEGDIKVVQDATVIARLLGY